MERLQERLISAKKALDSLQKLVTINQPNDVERDASIQRFEFTFEACWKAAKQYLYDIEGVDVGSPKSVIRSSREINIFNDEEAIVALKMVNDRNLTVHTYNEEVAIMIHSSLKNYYELMANWIQRMEKRK
jgi:nucleotidyltransferase substrate binding protein (TIGR01987 family)